MLTRLLLFVALCSFLHVGHSKEKKYITFQKKEGSRQIKMKLPLKCRVYQEGKDKRFGRITSYTDHSIFFEFKDYDTSEVNKILAIDTLSRKEKYDLVDTLIQHSKLTTEIELNQLNKISMLSGDDNVWRQLGMLGGSLGFMSSGIILLISTQNNVGQKWTGWNWIELGGMLGSAGLMTGLVKRNIDMKKWTLVKS